MGKSMNKRIVIKIGSGTPETGYTAAVQIGNEDAPPQVETQAGLPPVEDLAQLYQQWQHAYWQMGLPSRLEAVAGETNFSDISRLENCQRQSRRLRDRVHKWLNSSAFQPIREKILEQLAPTDTARVLLQTSDPLLQRIPWYELDFFQRYRNAEVGICPVAYQQVYYSGSRSEKVRILAVLGDDRGLDTTIDRSLLENLIGAEIHFLDSPSRQIFTQALWERQGWDILFFAGHSNSSKYFQQSAQDAASKSDVGCDEEPECNGEIWLNPDEKLTIRQLRHALRKAIDRGLNTAIFNSCDGLGLAADLADLHIPQVLVMREPVPDQVAHAFLQGFLESFSSGTPFYTAVRDAREQLQGLEAQFPCATWLPVIIQNLAEVPPTWQSLQGKVEPSALPAVIPLAGLSAGVSESLASTSPPLPGRSLNRSLPSRLKVGLGCGLAIAFLLTAARLLGLLEFLEIKGYDYSLRTRRLEPEDSHLLIVTNTAADIEAFPNPTRQSSFADDTLLKVLDKLTSLGPAVIGLDIYHGYSDKDPALKAKIRDTENLIAICKDEFQTAQGTTQRLPPPEIEDAARIGFNDFIAFEADGEVLRRHLLRMEPSPNSPCPTSPRSEGVFIDSFSAVIASIYSNTLETETDSETDVVLNPFLLTESFGGYHAADARGAQMMLNYRITRDPQQANCDGAIETPAVCLTVSELLDRDPNQLSSLVKDKIVLIGTIDSEYAAEDRWRTPYTRYPYRKTDEVHGIFLHAQMISQILSFESGDRPLIRTWSEWQEILWITSWALLGALIGTLTSTHTKPRLSLLIYLLVSGSLLLLTSWLLLTGVAIWTPWVPSAIALPTAAIATSIASKKTVS